jgi:hypothetical protein
MYRAYSWFLVVHVGEREWHRRSSKSLLPCPWKARASSTLIKPVFLFLLNSSHSTTVAFLQRNMTPHPAMTGGQTSKKQTLSPIWTHSLTWYVNYKVWDVVRRYAANDGCPSWGAPPSTHLQKDLSGRCGAATKMYANRRSLAASLYCKLGVCYNGRLKHT